MDSHAAVVSTTYRVEGMTCGHCVSAVTEQLSALDGVSTVSVDLAPGGASTVTVAGSKPLTDEQITRILQSQGIQVTRRTVAKYREDMKIPSTHQRRVRN
jgi:copper chaperone CopZ